MHGTKGEERYYFSMAMETMPNRYLQPKEAEAFWGELSPCEHLVEIYGDDAAFLDSLESFVIGGLKKKESVIVIATPQHLEAMESRLRFHKIDLADVKEKDLYIALDANETLAKFMVKGWPDDERFEQLIGELLRRGRRNGKKIRAFGEMVALLWARGETEAVIRLEHLWHRFCTSEAFCLFCAYPKAGFIQNIKASIREICDAHTQAFVT